MECNRCLRGATGLQFAFVKFPSDLVESLEDPSKEWSLQVTSDGKYVMYMSERNGEEELELKVKASEEDIEYEHYSMGHEINDRGENREQGLQLVCKSATKFTVGSIMASSDFTTAAKEVKEKTKEAAIEYKKRHTQQAKSDELMKKGKTQSKSESSVTATISGTRARVPGAKVTTLPSKQEQNRKRKLSGDKLSKVKTKQLKGSLTIAPQWIVIRNISPHIKYDDICNFFEGCKIATDGIYVVLSSGNDCFNGDVYVLFESVGGYNLSLQMDGEVMREAVDRKKVVCENVSICTVGNLEASIGKATGVLLRQNTAGSAMEMSTMIEESFEDIEFETIEEIQEKYKILFSDKDLSIAPDLVQTTDQSGVGRGKMLNVFEHLQRPENYIRHSNDSIHRTDECNDILDETLKKFTKIKMRNPELDYLWKMIYLSVEK